MTAADARKKALEVHTKSVDSEYATIKQMIFEAASKGEYECWVYNTTILPDVRAKLKDEGYEVEPTQYDRNETATRINW